MKTALKIFKSDIMKIVTNWVTLVVILGISILPPLYAWINIYASWDPYGNTKGLKVAVVNKDLGANLKGLDFDIGSDLISSLKTNDKIGWLFYDDEDDVLKILENGKIYAAIIIPEDFSSRMTTILSAKPVKPTLEYYVNEKSNAIASKMTDSVANLLQKQVSSSIVETAVNKAFEKFNEIGIEISEKYPDIEKYINLISVLNKDFPNTANRLDNLSKNVSNGMVRIDKLSDDFILVQDTMLDVIDTNENFSESLVNIDARIKEYSPEIKENLMLARSMFSNLSTSMESLSNSITVNKPLTINDIDNLLNDLNNFEKKINKFNDDIPELIDYTTEILYDITDLKNTLYGLRNWADNTSALRSLLATLSYDSMQIANKLSDLQEKVDDYFGAFDSALDALYDEFTQIEDVIGELKSNPTSENISGKISGLMTSISSVNNTLSENSSIYKNIIAVNKKLLGDLKALSKDISDEAGLSSLSSDNLRLSSYIDSLRSKLESKKSRVDNNLENAYEIFIEIRSVCKQTSSLISSTGKDLSVNINNILDRLTSIEDVLNKNNEYLSGENGNDNIKTRTSEILGKTNRVRSILESAKQSISDDADFENLINDGQKITYNIQSSLDTAVSSLDDTILPRIEKYLQNGSIFVSEINNILSAANDDIDILKDFLSDVNDNGEVSIDKINKVKEKLPEIQNVISAVSDKIDNINKKIGFNDIINFLKNDAGLESDFLSSPVALSTHKVYEMQNYGTGLAPFYTVLSLWVGILFLTALLTTRARNADFLYNPKQEFLGKYLVFAVFALVQGLIAALGDLLILKISAKNPVLFIFLCMFYSLLFCMIVYSLVATLNNVGKALGVVFMLLQLTGSGGTFPIQVTPKFFQAIHLLLPFTYAISGLREAIFGVVFDALVKDIGILLLFFILFTLLGLFLKKPLNTFIKNFTKQLQKSGILEH